MKTFEITYFCPSKENYMHKIALVLSVVAILFQGCAQDQTNEKKATPIKREQPKVEVTFTLTDFLKENKDLDAAVDKVRKCRWCLCAKFSSKYHLLHWYIQRMGIIRW